MRFWLRPRTAFISILLIMAFVSPALASIVIERGPAYVRSAASTDAPVLRTAQEGDSFAERGESDDWYKIALPDGKEGFVLKAVSHQESPVEANMVAVPRGPVNVRSGPGEKWPSKDKLVAGTVTRVLATSGKWAYVTYSGGQGWLAMWLTEVKTMDAKQLQAGTLPRKVIAIRNGTRVRRGASEDFGTLASLKAGAQAEYLSSLDGWHRVKLASGTVGWVEASDVRLVSAEQGTGVSYDVGDDHWTMQVGSTGRANQNVNIRASRSTSATAIGSLSKGDTFQVQTTVEGWHQIQVGNLNGWVAGWLVTVDPVKGLGSVTLDKKNGTKLITITGDFPATQPTNVTDMSIAVNVPPRAGVRGRVDVYAGEIGTVELNASGVLVDFVEKPAYRVLESKAGLLKIELYPSVDRISWPSGIKEGVEIALAGYTEVSVSTDEARGLVSVRLPGAVLNTKESLGAKGAILGATARTEGNATVVDLRVAPSTQYNIRRTKNLVTLDILPRGLQGKIICIDPGHGGQDPGALGPRRIKEKWPNLDIALRLKTLLEQNGAKVVLTRSLDEETRDLGSRVNIARDSQADVLLSIHNNSSFNRSKIGTTLYYAETSLNAERSQRLARIVQRNLSAGLGTQDNGVKTAEFFVCRNSPVAAVTAEVAFMSNAKEEQLLRDQHFLDVAASSLLSALKEYFGDL